MKPQEIESESLDDTNQTNPQSEEMMRPSLPIFDRKKPVNIQDEFHKKPTNKITVLEHFAFVPHRQKIMMLKQVHLVQSAPVWEEIKKCQKFRKFGFYKDFNKSEKQQVYAALDNKTMCNFIANQCEQFNIKIVNTNAMNDKISAIELIKKKSLSCWCNTNPYVDVFFTEEGNFEEKFFMGKIYYQQDCSTFTFLIHDYDDKFVYRISTDCFSIPVWCDTFMKEPCVQFTVVDVTGQVVTIGKKIRGGVCDSKSFFEINFLESMNWVHRSMLMACYLLIDYMVFDTQNPFNQFFVLKYLNEQRISLQQEKFHVECVSQQESMRITSKN